MNKEKENGRKNSGIKDNVRPRLDRSYQSPLIEKIRANNFCFKEGRLEVDLAGEFGFCYGVERAVAYAYDTRAKFPERRIFLIDEIIHNPRVNQELREMGILFLSGPFACDVKMEEIGEKDVVIMPAFGVSVEALNGFRERGCLIIDTTCGSVMSVWRQVEAYSRDGFTTVIHGKYDHEETRATCSRANKYLVIRDKKQAHFVCDGIVGRVSRDSFLQTFKDACSKGFDPEKDLERIGFANQTTMLRGESVEISNMICNALRERYGEAELTARFRQCNTICSATQDRQDAVQELGEKKKDLILVIGGYKSSNTGHLAEIASKFAPTYHVEDVSCLVSAGKIRHKKINSSEVSETKEWLPAGEVKIGITAGASTPNRVIEEVIERLIEIAK